MRGPFMIFTIIYTITMRFLIVGWLARKHNAWVFQNQAWNH